MVFANPNPNATPNLDDVVDAEAEGTHAALLVDEPARVDDRPRQARRDQVCLRLALPLEDVAAAGRAVLQRLTPGQAWGLGLGLGLGFGLGLGLEFEV